MSPKKRVKAPPAGPVRLGLVQMSCVEDPAKNLRKALGLLDEAASKGAEIVIFQELFTSRYFCHEENHDHFRLSEGIPGPTTDAVGHAVKRHGITAVVPIFERRAAGVYHNSSALVGPDGRVASVYRKMHIPDDPGYFEKFYFTPGDLGFQATKTPRATVGTLICWDQWFPEAARLATLAGAEILAYPTAIGGIPADSKADHAHQADAWETMQRSHAIANGVFVAAVNRVGTENGVKFWGGSFLCDPLGVVVARASRTSDEVLVADADLSRVEYARQHWPFLRDRRIDAYIGIVRRFGE
jgi:N-carbamoylputrescine amidase